MSYKCKNSKCENFGKEINPGGRSIVKDGEVFFTGSICKKCGEVMIHIPNKMGNFATIVNKSDGRNL